MTLSPKALKNNNQNGQTLLATIIGITVFLLLANAVFTLVKTSYMLTSFNRARITARHLAQEKLELIRNLPFDTVGTDGGIPSGPLIQDETIERNGLSYIVKTDIVYVDDDFDDTAPSDLLPTDYKRIRVEVSWGGLARSGNNPVVLVSDIAPRGVETTAGGGTLSILVFDSNGEPVPQAEVTIVATTTTPAVNLTLETGGNGRLILPGAPICTSCYSISVTKSGHSIDRTYTTSEVTNPSKPPQTILEGQLTEISFAIDQTSSITLESQSSRDTGFAPVGSVGFTVRGTKIIGTDTTDNPVYKYNDTVTTSAGGSVTISDLEWDTYEISLTNPSVWDISGSAPYIPILLGANTNQNLKVSLNDTSANNLLIRFTDGAGVPLASISATLTDSGTYNEELLSGQNTDADYGQVFFESLNSTTYTLQATSSAFSSFSSPIPVSGDTIYDVIMSP
jgi:hypothetical protein